MPLACGRSLLPIQGGSVLLRVSRRGVEHLLERLSRWAAQPDTGAVSLIAAVHPSGRPSASRPRFTVEPHPRARAGFGPDHRRGSTRTWLMGTQASVVPHWMRPS